MQWFIAYSSVPSLSSLPPSLPLDYLDLYLVHWPIGIAPDCTFPKEPIKDEERLGYSEERMAECWEVCLLRQGVGTRERERRERRESGREREGGGERGRGREKVCESVLSVQILAQRFCVRVKVF